MLMKHFNLKTKEKTRENRWQTLNNAFRTLTQPNLINMKCYRMKEIQITVTMNEFLHLTMF